MYKYRLIFYLKRIHITLQWQTVISRQLKELLTLNVNSYQGFYCEKFCLNNTSCGCPSCFWYMFYKEGGNCKTLQFCILDRLINTTKNLTGVNYCMCFRRLDALPLMHVSCCPTSPEPLCLNIITYCPGTEIDREHYREWNTIIASI